MDTVLTGARVVGKMGVFPDLGEVCKQTGGCFILLLLVIHELGNQHDCKKI